MEWAQSLKTWPYYNEKSEETKFISEEKIFHLSCLQFCKKIHSALKVFNI